MPKIVRWSRCSKDVDQREAFVGTGVLDCPKKQKNGGECVTFLGFLKIDVEKSFSILYYIGNTENCGKQN